jgi:hypothetical protein
VNEEGVEIGDGVRRLVKVFGFCLQEKQNIGRFGVKEQ